MEGGDYNDMFGKFKYPRKVLVAELSLLALSLVTTLLLGWGGEVQEANLRVLVLGATWVIDVAISLGIMVGVQLEGGVMVYYVFKTILLLHAEQYTVGTVIFPAVLCHGIFKFGVILLTRTGKTQEIDYRQIDERPKFIENQQKRRAINTSLLFLCSLVVIILSLYELHSQRVVLVVSLSAFVGVGIQLYVMANSAALKFKLISNSLSYNLYALLLLLAVLGKAYHNSYIHFTTPALTYLCLYFFAARVCIGSRSSKFHKVDQMLFEASYGFKGDNAHKFYRESSSSQPTLRVIDRLSRQLLVAIYFLSFIAAVQLEAYFWLPASLYLMNSFPVQDVRPFKIIAFLQNKFNLSLPLRPILTIPIAILTYLMHSKENSRREYLFDEINHCTDSTHRQLILLCFLMGSTVASHCFPANKRWVILRVVQWASPFVIFLWVFWIQCLHLKIVLLGLYVLAFCLQSLTTSTRSRVKGAKSN